MPDTAMLSSIILPVVNRLMVPNHYPLVYMTVFMGKTIFMGYWMAKLFFLEQFNPFYFSSIINRAVKTKICKGAGGVYKY